MAKEVKDYIREELNVIESRIRNYTEYGYSDVLDDVVSVLVETKVKLIKLLEKELKHN